MAAQDPNRLEHFDGLRGLAAVFVFGVHDVYQYAVARPGDRWWYRFAVHLDIAVPIFLVISGFLLYRPFLRATLGGRQVDVRAYAWRRVTRLVPAYWVALAVIGVWFGLGELASVTGVLRFGLFAQVYDSRTALQGIGQAWTLNVEVVYYALLPLFALVLVRARTVRAAALGCCGVVLAGVAWKVLALSVTDASVPASRPWLLSLPAHLDALGVGMLLAVLSVATEPPRVLAALARRPAVAWALGAVVWILIGLFTDGGTRSGGPVTDPQYLAQRVLYAGIAGLLVLPAVLADGGRGAVRRFLRWSPLAGLGVVSYSFYLWHLAVVAQVARWWDGVPTGLGWIAWVAAGFGLSVLVAVPSYRLVERPGMRLGRLVPGRRREATVDVAQAAP